MTAGVLADILPADTKTTSFSKTTFPHVDAT